MFVVSTVSAEGKMEQSAQSPEYMRGWFPCKLCLSSCCVGCLCLGAGSGAEGALRRARGWFQNLLEGSSRGLWRETGSVPAGSRMFCEGPVGVL